MPDTNTITVRERIECITELIDFQKRYIAIFDNEPEAEVPKEKIKLARLEAILEDLQFDEMLEKASAEMSSPKVIMEAFTI